MKNFQRYIFGLATACFSLQLLAEETPSAAQKVNEEKEKKRYLEMQAVLHQQLASDEKAHIILLIEEMIDEVVADMRGLKPKQMSPLAIQRVQLSENLSPSLRGLLETKLVGALSQDSPLTVKRCAKCGSVRSRLEGGDWVVSVGLAEQEDLQREAEQIGVVAFLTVDLGYYPDANVLVMQVEVTAAEDGRIFWAESYRSDTTTAAILRSGDRVVSRAERVTELERKLAARPYYGHMLYTGGAFIPYDSPTSSGYFGLSLGYRLYEKFGADRRWMFAVGGEAFAALDPNDPLLGSFIGGTVNYDLITPNVNSISLRTGPTINVFIAGNEGNSVAFEWGLDAIMQFRLGLGANLFYFVPSTFAGSDLGGFGTKFRMSFNW